MKNSSFEEDFIGNLNTLQNTIEQELSVDSVKADLSIFFCLTPVAISTKLKGGKMFDLEPSKRADEIGP